MAAEERAAERSVLELSSEVEEIMWQEWERGLPVKQEERGSQWSGSL